MTEQEALHLVQSALEALEALEGPPQDTTDEDIISCLGQRGVSPVDADRLVVLLPVAFGRAILQQKGVVAFRDDALVSHPGGKTTTIHLSDQPIYVAAVKVGVASLHHGTPTPRAFGMLADRSVDLKLILSAINSGERPDRAPQPSIGFYGYEEGVFIKPPWWRRRIF